MLGKAPSLLQVVMGGFETVDTNLTALFGLECKKEMIWKHSLKITSEYV